MFTGLIEEIGYVSSLAKAGSGYILTVNAVVVLEGLKHGDSVAVDGACQTVVGQSTQGFSVFVSEVTVAVTTLSGKHPGEKVNLERAMSAQGRFGGHIVQGHIDGMGKIISATSDSKGLRLGISAEPQLMKYIVAKGSVCVNGVSLTVVSKARTSFDVYLIPETLDRTTLPLLREGDAVNIETDIIAKYVENMLGAEKTDDASLMRALSKNGFI